MDVQTDAMEPPGEDQTTAPEVVVIEQRPVVPSWLAIAMNFVAHCNQHMGMRACSGPLETSWQQQELHPTQEGAFRLACEVIGRYFASVNRLIEEECGRTGKTSSDHGTA